MNIRIQIKMLEIEIAGMKKGEERDKLIKQRESFESGSRYRRMIW